MEQSPNNRTREIATRLAAIIVIAGLVVAVVVVTKKKSSDTFASSMPSASTSSSTADSRASSDGALPAKNGSTYRDGSYTATGDYNSPGGSESITVSVTLKGGTVTATSAQSGANDGTAEFYQDQFISRYKQFVVGKPISSLNLSRVSGSSLTSQGFNEAIAGIRQQAQS